jgi:hypothetical protein
MHFIRHPEYLREYVAYFDNNVGYVTHNDRLPLLEDTIIICINIRYKMLSSLFC